MIPGSHRNSGHRSNAIFSALVALLLVFSFIHADSWVKAQGGEWSEFQVEEALPTPSLLPVCSLTLESSISQDALSPLQLTHEQHIPSVHETFLLAGHSSSDLSPPLSVA